MPIFAFYDFKIGQRKDEEADMFKEQEKEDNTKIKQYDSPEACFASFFKKGGKLSLNVLREKGKGKEKTTEWEPFENDVLMVADGVILMTIENNKWKHTTNKKKDVAHEHHPFCHVVIDNRPGHQVMAVVKNSAFDNKPDKVCGILYQAFNNAAILGQYHLKIEFTKRQRKKNEFWPEDTRDWHLPCNNKAPFHFGRVLHITNTTKGDYIATLTSFAKTWRTKALRVMPASWASMAMALWISGETRTLNEPLYGLRGSTFLASQRAR